MRTVLASVLAATLAVASFASTSIALAKPAPKAHVQKRLKGAAHTQWMRECIHERTGPDGGIPYAEAYHACLAEQPEDEVDIAKRQLAVAKAKSKANKAAAKARKAIEQCHQAIVDACVEGAEPDGSTGNCEDDDLEQQFIRVCGAGSAARTEGK